MQNELLIEDEKPIQISRNHASIENTGGKCVVRDRGSRLGTTVNGVHIGVRSSELVAELKEGENTVILGNPSTSAHRYTVNVATAR
jgi:pSer/pThr/pTyr-binding forkhead associated (FHA) protein